MFNPLTRITVVALAALAVAAPGAFAMPDFPVNSTAPVPERTTEPATLQAVEASPAPVPERVTEPAVIPVAGPTVVVEADEASTFDWGAAAIGAGIVLAVVLLGAAAAAATSRHGGLRPSH